MHLLLPLTEMLSYPDLHMVGSFLCFKSELKRPLLGKTMPDDPPFSQEPVSSSLFPTPQDLTSIPPEREHSESTPHVSLVSVPDTSSESLAPGPPEARHRVECFCPESWTSFSQNPATNLARTFFQRLQACPIADQVLITVTVQRRHPAPSGPRPLATEASKGQEPSALSPPRT